MSCKFDKDIIHRYAGNDIDPLEYIFLKEHVRYCEECREEVRLAMVLEQGLEDFFSETPVSSGLESLIEGLVDDCMYELSGLEKLKFTLEKRLELGRTVYDNTLRFFSFLPVVRRGRKETKSASAANKGFLRGIVKKKVTSMLEGVTISI